MLGFFVGFFFPLLPVKLKIPPSARTVSQICSPSQGNANVEHLHMSFDVKYGAELQRMYREEAPGRALLPFIQMCPRFLRRTTLNDRKWFRGGLSVTRPERRYLLNLYEGC